MEALSSIIAFCIEQVASIYIASTVACLISLAIFFYYKRCHSYWSSRAIPGPSPSIFVGNSLEMMAKPMFTYDKELIAKYGDLVGIYDRSIPMLLVSDPAIVHDTTVKQFHHFIDRRDLNADSIITNMLICTSGSEWKRTRKLMSPAFTPSKIRSMGQLMLIQIRRMLSRIDDCDEINLKSQMYKLAVQVIVRSAFGVDLADGAEADIALHHAQKITKVPKWKMFVGLLCPYWIKRLFNFTIFDRESFQYFSKLAKHIVTQRKLHPNEKRQFTDFVDHMLEVDESEKDFLNSDQLMANFVLILAAGFETSASLLINFFFVIAHNQQVQDKLRETLSQFEVKNDEDLEQNLEAFPYLDACIREVLRLYPPGIRTERIATDRVTLCNGLTVDKGTVIAFAIHCLHRNEKYWPEADKFDPERFMPENKDSINQYAFMPFHIGPRNCIGQRFAINEARLAIIEVIKRYKLLPSSKTSYPIDYSKSIFVLSTPSNEVMIRLEKV